MTRLRLSRLLIWRELRRRDEFTLLALASLLGLEYGTVHRYVSALEAGGYVELLAARDRGQRESQSVYRLIKNTGIYPPSPKGDGVDDPNLAPELVDARSRMWRVMRMKKTFGIPDIAAITEQPYGSVHRYLKTLVDAGYLRLLASNESGRAASWNRYLLIRNAGPYAPSVQAGGEIFDPNTYDPREGTTDGLFTA